MNIKEIFNKTKIIIDAKIETLNNDKEVLIISLLLSIIPSSILSYIFSIKRHYRIWKNKRIEVSENYSSSTFSINEYNYFLFGVLLIVLFFVIYFYISRKRTK